MELSETLTAFLRENGSPFSLPAEDTPSAKAPPESKPDAPGSLPRFGLFSPPRDAAAGKLFSDELGQAAAGTLILLALPEPALRQGGRLRRGKDNYYIHAAEDFELAGKPLYCRAILQKCREEDAFEA